MFSGLLHIACRIPGRVAAEISRYHVAVQHNGGLDMGGSILESSHAKMQR